MMSWNVNIPDGTPASKALLMLEHAANRTEGYDRPDPGFAPPPNRIADYLVLALEALQRRYQDFDVPVVVVARGHLHNGALGDAEESTCTISVKRVPQP